MAAVLSELLGREVRVAEVPLEAAVPTLMRTGASENFAELFRDMHAGLDAGRVVWEGGRAEFKRGKVPLKESLRALLANT